MIFFTKQLSRVTKTLVLGTFLASSLVTSSLAAERPNIWVKASDRDAILQKIENQDWAASLYKELKKRADTALATYEPDPEAYLRGLDFEGKSASGHPQLFIIEKDGSKSRGLAARHEIMNRLQDSIDCGVLYYLTGDERYAKLTADVLSTYVRGVEDIEPSTAHNGGLLYPTNHLKEARIFGAQVPLLYDFAHPYLAQGGGALNLATSQREPFPFELAQRVFRIYVDRAINTGIVDCNWPVLEASSLVCNILALDDPAERAQYLPYYLDTDTKNQDSLRRVAEIYRDAGGVWPEPQGYAASVGHYTTYLMTLLERRDPSLKIGERYPEPAASLIRMESLRFPNGDVMTLGDAHGPRDHKPLYEAFEYAYHLAKIGGDTEKADIYGGLLKDSIKAGAYDRSILRKRSLSASPYYVPLQLLWQEPTLKGEFVLSDLPRTDDITFAGLFLQRNLSPENLEQDSLMSFMAAGHFIHAHATGLNAEFYGKGEVLGLRGGTGEYGDDLHENYYVLAAGGNTVISNGASATAGGWVHRHINQAERVSVEPLPRQAAVSPHHSFTTADFFDEHNAVAPAHHRRTMAIVRTSPSTGYYVDIFRAKSDYEGQFHDYLYHNLGETLTFKSANGESLAFSPTPDRYPIAPEANPHPRYKYDQPGWHFFEEVKTAPIGNLSLLGEFIASNFGSKPLTMRAYIPQIGDREVTTVISPPSLSSKGKYRKQKTPAFLIRQQGEAWDQPFAAVYEPGLGKNDQGTISSVHALSQDGKFCGLQIESKVGKQSLTQYVLILEPGQIYQNAALDLHFQGHFAIVTVADKGKSGSLYLGDGSKLTYGKHELEQGPAYLNW